MPRPEFPQTVIDFQRQFATDEACYGFVRDCRWPDGFKCPKCGHGDAYDRVARKQVECAKCGYCGSVTAGTVMANTKIPLQKWLWAAWLTVVSKGGHSASELSRQLGVHLETAFTMLHKLRHAMVAPERGMLKGVVEVDETYIGGPVRGRGPGKFKGAQDIVVGAVENRNGTAGRVRFRVVEDGNAKDLQGFVRDVVEEGSTVVTDGNRAYIGLTGYKREVQISDSDGRSKDDTLRLFHIAAGNLKAWILGTHHGRIESKNLQAYLNEFTFRFNRRKNLAAAFQTLLGLVPGAGPFTYKDIYADEPMHPNPSRKRKPTKRWEWKVRR